MAENITVRINDSLKQTFNIDDPIYKSLICNADGVFNNVTLIPSEFGLGAVTNLLEYLRLLAKNLLDQLFVDSATGEFLKYQLETFFSSLKYTDETESEWISRTVAMIFYPKVSRASIISVMRQFSSQEPEISPGTNDGMFADCSFADRYERNVTTYNGVDFNVYPAIMQTADYLYFHFIITLYDIDTAKLFTIVSLLNKFIVAGVTYTLELKTT